MPRVLEAGDRAEQAVGRERVLREVVGADGGEVGHLEHAVGEQRGRGHLDHDADRLEPVLAAQLGEVPRLLDGGDHRRHDPQVGVGLRVRLGEGRELLAQDVLVGAQRRAGRGGRAPGCPRARRSGTPAACPRPRRARARRPSCRRRTRSAASRTARAAARRSAPGAGRGRGTRCGTGRRPRLRPRARPRRPRPSRGWRAAGSAVPSASAPGSTPPASAAARSSMRRCASARCCVGRGDGDRAGRRIHDDLVAVGQRVRAGGADDRDDRLLARQDRGVRGRAALLGHEARAPWSGRAVPCRPEPGRGRPARTAGRTAGRPARACPRARRRRAARRRRGRPRARPCSRRGLSACRGRRRSPRRPHARRSCRRRYARRRRRRAWSPPPSSTAPPARPPRCPRPWMRARAGLRRPWPPPAATRAFSSSGVRVLAVSAGSGSGADIRSTGPMATPWPMPAPVSVVPGPSCQHLHVAAMIRRRGPWPGSRPGRRARPRRSARRW